MLLYDQNLPIRIIGQGTVANDLVDFLHLEGKSASAVSFENVQLDKNKHDYQYLLGILNNVGLRKLVIKWFDNNQLWSPAYLHDNAEIDRRATIQPGVVAYPTSYIQNASIGKHCFFSGFSLVSHKSVLGQNVVLYPYATCLGSCEVGNNTLLQTRSTVSDKIKISCDDVNLLPMTFVNKNITVPGTYGGSLAKFINKNAC